jgi:hypothetical protein
MASGFGMIDYFVVLLSFALTAYFMVTKPERLLLLLPTFLTIDFFIPFGSQLTPGRLVPLMIGVWVLVNYGALRTRKYSPWIGAAFFIIFASFFYALISGDAGLRSVLRALSYVNLVFIFLFVYHTAEDKRTFALAVWGLAIAGMLHGGYAVYQFIAHKIGLPFRGIVYNEFGSGVVGELAGAFRINGLADEPKRLGYILFAAALAAAWLLTLRKTTLRQRRILNVTAWGCLGVSLLTYSTSYYIVLPIWMALYFLISAWVRKFAVISAFLAAGALLVVPSALTTASDRFADIVLSRSDEVAQGLDARFVYRQEFYAQALLKDNPVAVLTGVGLGRYNKVLEEEYGAGAGFDLEGFVKPLNSQVLEVVLDLGLPGLLLLYGAAAALIWRLGRRGRQRLLVGGIVSFLAIQSVLIGNLPYLVFSMGMAAAFLGLIEPLKRSRPALKLSQTFSTESALELRAFNLQHSRRA